LLSLFGNEIQEVPLWHEGDELALSREMCEVAQDKGAVPDLAGNLPDFLVRALQEFIENSEFVHELERGGMYGVAPKIAQEVLVFFEHHDINAHACEQVSRHHAGWTTAGNAAPSCNGCRHTPQCTQSQHFDAGFEGIVAKLTNPSPDEPQRIRRTCPAGIWDLYFCLSTLEIPLNLSRISP
jgi:hypothetical protein